MIGIGRLLVADKQLTNNWPLAYTLLPHFLFVKLVIETIRRCKCFILYSHCSHNIVVVKQVK